MDEARKPIASAILPISGLRRDSNGTLTNDAMQTVMDSLRSRGIDMSNDVQVMELLRTAGEQICILNEQYQFLLLEVMNTTYANQPLQEDVVSLAIEKNQMILDILALSRQVKERASATGPMLQEGFWQAGNGPFAKSANASSTKTDASGNKIKIDASGNKIKIDASGNAVNASGKIVESKLQLEQQLLKSKSYVELRKHSVEVTEEKNRAVSHQLAIYGFLNLVAIGLLLYISMGR